MGFGQRLLKNPGQCQYRYPFGTCFDKCLGAFVNRGACRINIINQDQIPAVDFFRQSSDKRAGNIFLSFLFIEASLR